MITLEFVAVLLLRCLQHVIHVLKSWNSGLFLYEFESMEKNENGRKGYFRNYLNISAESYCIVPPVWWNIPMQNRRVRGDSRGDKRTISSSHTYVIANKAYDLRIFSKVTTNAQNLFIIDLIYMCKSSFLM